MERGLFLVFACLTLVLTMAASSAPAKQATPPAQADLCTWGASSVVVEEVDGKWVQSEPATTGCIP